MQPVSPAPAGDAPHVASLVERALAFGAHLVEGVRTADRWLRYKVLILGVWILSSALVVPAVGAIKGEGINEIGADVKVVVAYGGRTLGIRNSSTEDWSDVEIVVNEQWIYHRRRIGAAGRTTVFMRDFVRLGPGEDGQAEAPMVGGWRRRSRRALHAPESLAPEVIRITTSQGVYHERVVASE